MTDILKNLPEDRFRALCTVLKILRSPDGCPWDRKQTHESLVTLMLEEAYEVVDAIDQGDWNELKMELGDLMMHIIFQAQLSEQEDQFDIDDVLDNIIKKLVRRHPHVFGDVEVADEEEVAKNWEQIKLEEGRDSVLEGVPKALSGLIRAQRIQQKAAQVGFDWDDAQPVWEKVREEWHELREVVESGETDRMEEEFGDLIFTLVNLSRFLKINPEDALRKTTTKFTHRFQSIEKRIKEQGLDMNTMSLEELDTYWEQVKSQEND